MIDFNPLWLLPVVGYIAVLIYVERRSRALEGKGLCVRCGERPPVEDDDICALCRAEGVM